MFGAINLNHDNVVRTGYFHFDVSMLAGYFIFRWGCSGIVPLLTGDL